MRAVLIVLAVVIAIAGCVSVYLINASPDAQMERGEIGTARVERGKGPPPPAAPQPTTPETR